MADERPLRDLWPEPQLLYTRETASISDINVEPRAREGCGIEGEKYEDILRSEYCRNRTGLDAIPLALGQLLRISPVGSSIKWQSCKFVFPHITFTLEMMEVKDLCLKPLGESQLFTNDMMSGVLWPLGDTLEEARTRSWTLWVVDEETGTVYEIAVLLIDQEDKNPPRKSRNSIRKAKLTRKKKKEE
ncbi:unnamed protein product [Rhizophagus irregularis]|nr:unnamed protein product [Rhizophagus irregularis]